MKAMAHMRVRFTLEVPMSGSFGPEWTMGQMHDDAERQLHGVAKTIARTLPGSRVVGEPTVVHTVVETEKARA